MPNPIDGVDILNFIAVALWVISYTGCLTWMNFFSDTVRNWRTDQFDEEGQPIQDKIADWFKSMTPLAVQLIVLIISFVVPIVLLVILIAVGAVEITSPDQIWGFVVTWTFAWLTSQQRYQSIKEPSEVALLEYPAAPRPAGSLNVNPPEHTTASRQMG